MTYEPTPYPTPEVNVITDVLYAQIMNVMGLKHRNWVTKCLYPIFASPVKRMSGLLVELDRNIVVKGWNQAAQQFLGNFITNISLCGDETIPEHGPLVVACNHPAAYDVAILSACIRRDDLKIIASDVLFIQKLPNLANHVIPVPYHLPSRLQTVRAAMRHLNNAGALLIFPRGNVEPDPAVSPGAEQSLNGWSASIELFLRKVPETITTVAIASGMLSGKWFKNPLIQIWKKYEQRQKVAEIFQIGAQLLTGRKPDVTPRISFSSPLTIHDLGGVEAPEGMLLAAMTAQARRLLLDHPHH